MMQIQRIWILSPDYELWNTFNFWTAPRYYTLYTSIYTPILHTFTFISLVRQTVENRTTVVTKCSPRVIGVHLPLMQVRTLGNTSLELSCPNSIVTKVYNRNSVAHNCAELRPTVRNWAQLFSNYAQLLEIARNCKEFIGLAIARKKNPLALETLIVTQCQKKRLH